jgi:hypothetical protein
MRGGRLLGAGVSAVLVALAIVLAVVGGNGGDEAAAGTELPPRIVGRADLLALEDDLGHSVYWAGPRPPLQLELSVEEGGNVFLRYLPPSAEAGDPSVEFLTVGTYEVPDAQEALRETAEEAGASLGRAAGDAVTLENPASQGSVYLAYPDSDLEIEVYDPAPGRALQLIEAGAIGPVG